MTTRNLFIIDPRVENAQSLIDALPAGSEWVVLESGSAGVRQLEAILEREDTLDAISILAHGAPGQLNLGALALTLHNLQDHAAILERIGAALKPNGDLLLYGCEIGAGSMGAAFVEALAAATGANVAASDNATGAASLGGDWALEIQTGPITTPILDVPEYKVLLEDNSAPQFHRLITTNFTENSDESSDVLVLSNGKILVAGTSNQADFALAQYTADGELDPTFGNGGLVVTDLGAYEQAYSVIQQADGKILVAGSTDGESADGKTFALARYNENGTLDEGFNTTGMITIDLGESQGLERSVVIDSNNNIVVANSKTLARFTSGGQLDTTFGSDGKVSSTIFDGLGGDSFIRSIALDDDGILLAGTKLVGSSRDFALARYTNEGVLDTTFGGTGFVTTDFGGTDPNFNEYGTAIAVQGDGKILVAGHHNVGTVYAFGLARYTKDGVLDDHFRHKRHRRS
jgi:uncharacterized delta-60 repeat protein